MYNCFWLCFSDIRFVLYLRWNFSEVSLCNLVRASLNPVLDYSKPSFIGKIDKYIFLGIDYELHEPLLHSRMVF